MGRLRTFWLVLLAASVAALLSAGTLAAYNATITLTGTITAAKMVFRVNDSVQETQSLGSATLMPGESTTIPIVIDTSGTEVAMDVQLSMTVSGSDLPGGLSVRVDGTSVGPSGIGTYTATYAGMNGSSRTVPVVVSWAATVDQLKSVYTQSQNFTLSLSATVTATQT